MYTPKMRVVLQSYDPLSLPGTSEVTHEQPTSSPAAVPFLPIVMLAVTIALAGVSPVFASGQPKKLHGPAAKGEALAIEHCSRCHVIGPFNKFGGIGSTPSFPLIAGMKDGMDRFQTFFERRPHPAFVTIPGITKPGDTGYALPFTVTTETIDGLMAYVKTIERKDLDRVPVVGGVGPTTRQRVRGGRLQ